MTTMDATTYDWTRFELVYYYDRPLDAVFASWSTSAGLESFFVAKAHFTSKDDAARSPGDEAQPGDRYRWEWRHAHHLEGEVTSVVPKKQIAFTFGGMSVSVTFTKVGGQTELHLVQTEIPDSAPGRVSGHLNCRSCWIFFLVNLKSVLDAGRDLRDANPDRVSSIEVGFEPLSSRQ